LQFFLQRCAELKFAMFGNAGGGLDLVVDDALFGVRVFDGRVVVGHEVTLKVNVSGWTDWANFLLQQYPYFRATFYVEKVLF
jgi:hypothetical protein